VLLRLNDWIARALLTVAAVLAFLLCFLVCADVIGRVVFNSPVKGTPEIVSGSIVMILWLQAAYAIRSGGMIWVDALHVHLPNRAQRVCDVFGALLGIAFLGERVGWFHAAGVACIVLGLYLTTSAKPVS